MIVSLHLLVIDVHPVVDNGLSHKFKKIIKISRPLLVFFATTTHPPKIWHTTRKYCHFQSTLKNQNGTSILLHIEPKLLFASSTKRHY